MPLRPPESLAALQRRFADHIRNPDHAPAPAGIEDRRMSIYRRLFFNNLRNLLGQQFPSTRKLFDTPAWEVMIRDFMIRHRPVTPLFPELPDEFMRYLTEVRENPDDPPFLLELAHFEWSKRRLRLDEREVTAGNVQGDLLHGIPVLSPLTRLAAYRFPVHRIDADYRPATPSGEPTLLLMYRKLNERSGYLQLNPVSARLFQLLQENERHTGHELLNEIAKELKHADAGKVIGGGREMLNEFRQRDILLGTQG